jgi:hypothetical protein
MRRSRRIAVYAIVTGFLTAGAITAGLNVAQANTAGFCSAQGAQATCTKTLTISNPDTITVAVTMEEGSNQDATVAWTANCSQGGQSTQTSGGSTAMTPVSDDLILPYADPDSCTVTMTGTLSGSGYMLVNLTYTPAPGSSPSPSTAPVHLYKGFGGKCLDDAGNSAANRTKIQIWTCSSNDAAQQWSFSGGELVHNGRCINDQASGGNGGKVILYTCNGAANEIWTHQSNGEFRLKARGGLYCLDDPASSTRNGTQLIMYVCKDSANQRWSQQG